VTPGGPPPDGDVNLDGSVNVLDVQLVVNVILGAESNSEIVLRSDLTQDGRVDVLDVQSVINTILGT
jgi:hypothetical protein